MAAVAAALTVLGLAGCGQGADDAAVLAASEGVVAAAATPTATPTDLPTPVVEVVVTHGRDRELIKLPFRTVHRKTATLKKGVTKVARPGRPGLRVKVFRLTLEDGLEVDRELMREGAHPDP